jgi:ERO1-like protein beta
MPSGNEVCIWPFSLPRLLLNWDQVNELPGCYYRDSDFCFLDSSPEGEYIDLVENPERFTGYAAPASHRVWNAIYQENCFGQSEATWPSNRPAVPPPDTLLLRHRPEEEETCVEKRVFYRIISGLHASISTHICMEYFNQTTGTWVCGPSHFWINSF